MLDELTVTLWSNLFYAHLLLIGKTCIVFINTWQFEANLLLIGTIFLQFNIVCVTARVVKH